MKVLVTGATGFVGRPLCKALAGSHQVRAALRRKAEIEGAEAVVVGEIDEQTDWSAALSGVDVVIHLAARAHVMSDTAAFPLAEYCRVNVSGSRRLAGEAARAGVKRLVYVSSIKVNGEATTDRAFDETTPASPQDPYGESKWRAEQALAQIATSSRLELVVLRPPLIYGPAVKGNLDRLLKLVDRGIPLPLGLVRNRRSLIALDNLISVVQRAMEHPAAAGETFLVSDGREFSTADLVRNLALGMGRRSRLLPVPPVMLYAAGALLRRQAVISRLCGSLVIDSAKVRRVLQWDPPRDPIEALQGMAARYR